MKKLRHGLTGMLVTAQPVFKAKRSDPRRGAPPHWATVHRMTPPECGHYSSSPGLPENPPGVLGSEPLRKGPRGRGRESELYSPPHRSARALPQRT